MLELEIFLLRSSVPWAGLFKDWLIHLAIILEQILTCFCSGVGVPKVACAITLSVAFQVAPSSALTFSKGIFIVLKKIYHGTRVIVHWSAHDPSAIIRCRSIDLLLKQYRWRNFEIEFLAVTQTICCCKKDLNLISKLGQCLTHTNLWYRWAPVQLLQYLPSWNSEYEMGVLIIMKMFVFDFLLLVA